jgi:hypothetical protein
MQTSYTLMSFDARAASSSSVAALDGELDVGGASSSLDDACCVDGCCCCCCVAIDAVVVVVGNISESSLRSMRSALLGALLRRFGVAVPLVATLDLNRRALRSCASRCSRSSSLSHSTASWPSNLNVYKRRTTRHRTVQNERFTTACWCKRTSNIACSTRCRPVSEFDVISVGAAVAMQFSPNIIYQGGKKGIKLLKCQTIPRVVEPEEARCLVTRRRS